ncbi:Haem-binding domain-containing protein [Chitinophaga rupis]|uniref:Haem-binding domain-containing protein n=1 Tax=Chitinophaga rupis TaxID=573321 RepID=A0A1H7R9G2_9BACT|nr:heme-binding domain-containing protein [Chitinophaga rupis]SEL56920.1 Haem-binding domain-containing protein [Chitinophaga rupis]
MSRTKKWLLVLFAVFVAIQFIQPARNKSGQLSPTDISRIYSLSGDVQVILQKSCFDCHSNNTTYPWYSNIQPVGWWLASHIRKGKAALNFSEFGNYSRRRQQNKLQSIENSINDRTMPLPAYTLIHKNAALSPADKRILLDWVNTAKTRLSTDK